MPAAPPPQKPPARIAPALLTVPQGPGLVTLDDLHGRDLLPPVQIAGLDLFDAMADRLMAEADPEIAKQKTITFNDLIIRVKDTGDDALQNFGQIIKPLQGKFMDDLGLPWREAMQNRDKIVLRGLREIILKPRQLGFSTLILALLFMDTVNTPNTYTVIVADIAENAEVIFQIVRRYYDSLPPSKKPRKKYDSKRELSFPDIGSRFLVTAAGSGTFGRGSTINNLHLSEVAHWKAAGADGIASGLVNSVPDSGNIFLETTANGLGNYFHERYMAAKAGKSVNKNHFYPWYVEKDYRTPAPPDFVPTETEENLKALYPIDNDQLQWRRNKLLENAAKFKQEYPITDMEAFLVTGESYFDREVLNELYQEMTVEPSPTEIAALLASGQIPKSNPFVPWNADEAEAVLVDALAGADELAATLKTGELQVWKFPERGHRYVIGADVAEGLSKDARKDFDSADVLDADTMEQVAHLHGQWEPSEWGLLLSQLGYWYNTALVAVEQNNHGWSTLNTLFNGKLNKKEWVYPTPSLSNSGGIYHYVDFDEAARKRRSARDLAKVKKPGFPTNRSTKKLICDAMRDRLDDAAIKLNCALTVAELLTFVKFPGGGSGAEGKAHDDAVISLCIAAWVASMWKRGPKQNMNELRNSITNAGKPEIANVTQQGTRRASPLAMITS